jgi:hypothetical protein
MFHYIWPKYMWPPTTKGPTQQGPTQQGPTPKIKKIETKRETCDLCYTKRPINKWYSDEFFICNQCAACEFCNKIDDKIKCELDVNEITQICKSCSNV